MRNRSWVIGNIIIGAGSIIIFLYVLFGFFWQNPNLVPWYLVLLIVLFILFNTIIIKKHSLTTWIVTLLIAMGSAGITYLLHFLFVAR
ncbi:hypothetical protein J2T56_002621 [Natronobacillus azotifigens]